MFPTHQIKIFHPSETKLDFTKKAQITVTDFTEATYFLCTFND